MSPPFTGFEDPDDVATHPAVLATKALGPDLRKDADRVEQQGVTRERLDLLASLGLYAVLGPSSMGGVPVPVYRRVAELLAGADGQTWFVWFQHNPVCRMLAASTNLALRDHWLAEMCAGRLHAGVAFSHLRRPGRVVRAERTPGGWRLTGVIPWCTGFGLIDLVLVGAVTVEEPEQVIFGLVPLSDGPGMTATPMPDLAAMDATSTVELGLDRFDLSDERVVQIAPRHKWAAADKSTNANVQPSTFGIAEAALAGLAQQDVGLADALAGPIAAFRQRSYNLADTVAPGERDAERRIIRSEALLRTLDVTSAYVATCGGSGLQSTAEAQRLARHALFHLVFAQDPLVRATTTAALARRATGTGGMDDLPGDGRLLSSDELVHRATTPRENLTVDEVEAELSRGDAVLVDLREPDELIERGRISGSVHIPRGMLEFRADPTGTHHQEPLDPSRRVILHCATGGRSALAVAALRSMGYADVAHLDGGIAAWKEAGRTVE